MNNVLLAGEKFMPEMHLRILHIMLVVHFQKPNKEYKILWKQEIQDIFIKTD